MARKRVTLVHISQDELTKMEGEHTHKCKCCGKSIWYANTSVYIKADGLLGCHYGGTTYRTEKNINGVRYPIRICQKCLEEKYPDFSEKNISRIFNTFNKYVAYAFEIPKSEIDDKNKASVPTLENCIRKHGAEKGRLVFEEYKRKQAYTNSFEYKRDKKGWTKEQFDEYNKSRAVTLSNLIKRHGNDEGMRIWKEYCEKQAYTSSAEYISETFDAYEIETILLLKGCKLEGFVRRYGEVEGKKKFDEYVKSITSKSIDTNKYHQSRNGMVFFDKVVEELKHRGHDFKYYYGTRELKKYSHRDHNLYSLDFYIPDLNIDIEFNGDYWHANPELYDAEWFHPVKRKYAKEIWDYDKRKKSALESEFGMIVYEVWEKTIYTDKREDEIINKLVNDIEYVSKNKKTN